MSEQQQEVIRKCSKCGSTKTTKNNSPNPKWKVGERWYRCEKGLLCHTCYCIEWRKAKRASKNK